MQQENIKSLANREDMREQAQNNSFDNFWFGFEEVFFEVLLKRMDTPRHLHTHHGGDLGFGKAVKEYIAKRVYKGFVES